MNGQPTKMELYGRGYSKPEHLRANSTIDPYDRNPYDPCWHWLGAAGSDGTPRIWTFDHDRGDKAILTGARAAWNISKGKGTEGKLPYRNCFCTDCVNPGHVRLAADRAEIGLAIREAGVRKGSQIESRRANAAKARAARGVVETPASIVLAVRAAPRSVRNVDLAKQHDICPTTVSAIRRMQTRVNVTAEVA